MATLMLEGGADVRYIQQMLGHSRLETTEVYTHVSIRTLKAVHTATHPAHLQRTPGSAGFQPAALPDTQVESVATTASDTPVLTRTMPRGSFGRATTTGRLKDSDAVFFSFRNEVDKTKNDAHNVIAELFHVAGNGYSDKDLANAARFTKYADDAANFLDPSANVFAPGYIPGNGDEQTHYGYSVYFHTIQAQHCGLIRPSYHKNLPAKGGRK